MLKKLLCLLLALALCQIPAAAFTVGSAPVLSVSISHAALVDGQGNLWTWGRNYYGELGNGSREDSSVPVKVMEDVAAVSVSDGVTAAGLECWSFPYALVDSRWVFTDFHSVY